MACINVECFNMVRFETLVLCTCMDGNAHVSGGWDTWVWYARGQQLYQFRMPRVAPKSGIHHWIRRLVTPLGRRMYHSCTDSKEKKKYFCLAM